MNFLAPWFLLGVVAITGPIVFHLIRRSARERMPFSSLLFLRPTPPRATRRRKLEHIALLLLRCLGLLLLAIGFARPFLPQSNASPPSAEAGRQMVILLDTSASMRRDDLWSKARKIAEHYLHEAGVADRVAVVTFDQQPRPLFSFAEWSAWPLGQRPTLAATRLDAVSPSWAGTHLGLALTTAAEQFSEAGGAETSGPRDVVLISDMQDGAKLDGLQGHDWPKGVRVILERVDPKHPGNAGLEILDPAADIAADVRQARARVVNTKDSSREKFQLGWNADAGAMQVYLPPGQTRTFLAPPLPTNLSSGQLHLSGGEESFDNTAYFAASELEHVTVAYFGSESANDPDQLRYYLQRAFPETSRRVVSVLSASNSLVETSLAVIPSSLDADQVTMLSGWLKSGKAALLVLTNAAAGPTLAALTGLPDIDLADAPGDYALLGDIDFTHPIFAPFSDPRFSDFSHIHFWKHRRWTIPPNLTAHVLAKFDDGAPVLTQISIGKGNLLVLAAGWNPADSQLALSSKFLPLMQTILDWSGSAAPARSQFQIGDSVPSPTSSGAPLTWQKPDEKKVVLAAGTPFTDTDLPGIYSVTMQGSVRHFAVNVPLDESRTTPLSSDDLARLGVPLQTTADVPVVKTVETKRRALQEELENRQKLWRWLIVGLLGVALVEIMLGGWLSRRVTTVEVAA